jgi:hypothetical protein
MKPTLVLTILSLVAAACSTSATPGPAPSAPSSNDGQDDRDAPPSGQTGQVSLGFTAPCDAQACGEVPPSSRSDRPSCSPSSAGTCGWSDPDPDGSVSFRECAASECAPKPEIDVCPTGTLLRGATCGSENSGPCIWRSTCTPPRSTTPCPDPNGCGEGVPALAVMCKDGSVGGLACMQQGKTCKFEPTCD